MTTNANYAENLDSVVFTAAIAPLVAGFGFLAHDTSPPRACSASCFFVIVHGSWVMCTAAHVIDEVQTLLNNRVKLTDWHINDGFTQNESHTMYPFNVMERERFHLLDKPLGLDYCLIAVESLAVDSIAHCGVRAIARHQTGNPLDADKLVVTGFVSDFTQKNGSSITQRHYILGADRVERPDTWHPDENKASVFGRLDSAADPSLNTVNIGGMSGGPVFGLYKQDDGSSKIKLVAVQTGWKESTRIIMACPIDPFLTAVERLIDEGDIETEVVAA